LYDVTDKDSYFNVPKWLNEIERFASATVMTQIIGTKADLIDKKEVSFDKAKVLYILHSYSLGIWG